MVLNTVFCFYFFYFSVCFTWISKTADQLVRDTLNKNFFIGREIFSLIRQLYSVFCINNKCTIITDEVIIKCIKLRPWQAILFFLEGNYLPHRNEHDLTSNGCFMHIFSLPMLYVHYLLSILMFFLCQYFTVFVAFLWLTATKSYNKVQKKIIDVTYI